MASNADLTKQATEIAAELEIAITTDGLSNKDLATLVTDLKAKKKDADTVTQADDDLNITQDELPSGKKPEELAGEAQALPDFYVKEGKAITSKRGMLEAFDEIKASDLGGGEKALKALIESGHIGKN